MKSWFLPGLGLKRWIGILIIGGFLCGLSIGKPDGFYIDVLFILLGIFLVVISFFKLFFSIDLELRKRGLSVDEIYQEIEQRRGPKIVAIGGGTGLSTLLKGLRKYTVNITAVVTVSDEGGSSGRIRKDWGGVAIGDIRNCLLSLAETNNPWVSILKYRFERGELKGHSLGNLVLLALSESEGDFLAGVNKLRKILGIEAEVLPVTLSDVRLKAFFEDGSFIEGETEIPKIGKKITKIEIIPYTASVSPKVLDAIKKADIIVIGPGSLYTSLIPSLLFKDVVEAIRNACAIKFYICNIMTQPGETERFSVIDHLKEIKKYLGEDVIDYVIVNIGSISSRMLEKYKAEGAEPVKVDIPLDNKKPIFVCLDLVCEKDGVIRHDSYKLAEAILKIFRERGV
ncbi:MAG: YvcK family protein [Synergistetes bacterium]|nr:YvcK family protein [Synergistota bacterium]MCX8128206.1 YvcK family protein [Synergistota bacterium]MDW8192653.1 YvcK family protein [Synergistota bacterium]